MSVKMYLMWNSKMLILGGADANAATSLLEASNLVVLRESSVIHSNANLGVHGQGFLNLSGPGDMIEAQRLILSLFFSINIGPGSTLRGPLENASNNDMTPQLYCKLQDCPMELVHPPEDCNVNSSLSFTLQICRVEDIIVEGIVTGSVVHFHWIRTVVVHSSRAITTSALGCTGGVGRGKILNNGLSGGGGHGVKGGEGYYDGSFIEGGVSYGDADLPCELGSGSGNASLAGATAGGGIIVMGSLEHSLSSLSVYGSLRADGESFGEAIRKHDHRTISNIGPGGTILLFVHTIALGDSSVISTAGGHGSPSGGGGGGGRVHFHWSGIPTGDEYIPIASVKGSINTRGGFGRGQGHTGENGTITGKACPKGLYGGVTERPCPYKCISERYHMPHCYTALEELVYTFGGPWLFGLILLGLLVLLALVLSVARMKYVGGDELPALMPGRRGSWIDHSFPFLEFWRQIELRNPRVMFTECTLWDQIHLLNLGIYLILHQNKKKLLCKGVFECDLHGRYEDAFNRFVDEVEWACLKQQVILSEVKSWRIYLVLSLKSKFHEVASTTDLTLAYMDFSLGGDEKRGDLPPRLYQRFPMSLVFGGDGSYMAPFSLQSDNILTSLMSQVFCSTIWYRLVAGLNSQLRLVRCGHIKLTFGHVISWLETHANPTLIRYGVRVDLAWFEPTSSGYCQFGLMVCATSNENVRHWSEGQDRYLPPMEQSRLRGASRRDSVGCSGAVEDISICKKIYEGILHAKSLRTLKMKRAICYPFSFMVCNTKPVGHQDLVGLLISMLLLGDFSLVLLTLLQLYSISLLDFFLVLFILPPAIVFPFPAGISALFSHGLRRAAGLARVYALWNITSLINAVTAFVCGFLHYWSHSSKKHMNFRSWNFSMDESEWWMLPSGLVV
ncbi:hypothetical protein CRYUN_Cryun02cG0013400 [Craigia yunnanensis]